MSQKYYASALQLFLQRKENGKNMQDKWLHLPSFLFPFVFFPLKYIRVHCTQLFPCGPGWRSSVSEPSLNKKTWSGFDKNWIRIRSQTNVRHLDLTIRKYVLIPRLKKKTWSGYDQKKTWNRIRPKYPDPDPIPHIYTDPLYNNLSSDKLKLLWKGRKGCSSFFTILLFFFNLRFLCSKKAFPFTFRKRTNGEEGGGNLYVISN